MGGNLKSLIDVEVLFVWYKIELFEINRIFSWRIFCVCYKLLRKVRVQWSGIVNARRTMGILNIITLLIHYRSKLIIIYTRVFAYVITRIISKHILFIESYYQIKILKCIRHCHPSQLIMQPWMCWFRLWYETSLWLTQNQPYWFYFHLNFHYN